MKILRNMESAFSLVRVCFFAVIICNVISVLFAWGYGSWFNAKQNDKIYSLTGEVPVMIALGQNVKENRQAEAKAQLEVFHKLFFSLVPDMGEIKYNMAKAMLMADNSVSDQYTVLEESGYFRQICDAQIRCSYVCDSVKLDLNNYPYHAVVYGRTSIVRQSGTTIRQLVTSCNLRNVLRTDEIPHGFLIEGFTVKYNENIDNEYTLFRE
jgi:conjugative transposon TraK protein